MTDLGAYRRFFAEEIMMAANLRTPGLVDALAAVPREQFLPPGPWVVRGDADFMGPLRKTPNDDPRFIYHNIAVGIDPGRMLFNGAPGLLCSGIDALGLDRGKRVLHIGAGAGYYTAVMAHTVGPTGRVVGIEVDNNLAAMAATNLASMPWVDMRQGDGSDALDSEFDAILVNAGVTHPEPHWLDALAPGGRINLSLTVTMDLPPVEHLAGGAMANIGKGFMLLLTRTEHAASLDTRILTFVAIYSALGLRDSAINTELGRAMSTMSFPQLTRFRRDAHAPEASCWCHTSRGCWSTS